MKKMSIPQTDLIFVAVAVFLTILAIVLCIFVFEPTIADPASPPSFTVSTPPQMPTASVMMASALPGGSSSSGGGAASGGGAPGLMGGPGAGRNIPGVPHASGKFGASGGGPRTAPTIG